ncbi:MAG TPA: hypothetical protein PKA07_18590, partial [Micropruina sp.]|nr:hypothetical protein [Micropruina sp.]
MDDLAVGVAAAGPPEPGLIGGRTDVSVHRDALEAAGVIELDSADDPAREPFGDERSALVVGCGGCVPGAVVDAGFDLGHQ